MIYTEKIHRAIKFAAKTHQVYQDQRRKGKAIPYITHPLTVGLVLSLAGAKEEVIIAGILHDTIEDSAPEKKVTAAMLEERFGRRVARLVLSVTESDKLRSWEERKAEALEHIGKFSPDSVLIKSADVISNGAELLDDFGRYGDAVFDRFRAKKSDTLANYQRVIRALLKRWPQNPLAGDLRKMAKSLVRLEKGAACA